MKKSESVQRPTLGKLGSENNFDYSKAEQIIKNIVIPNSNFGAKWVEGEGYAIGYENVKLTKNYETLEEALNQIGYGTDREDNDAILVKVGEVDYEMIVRIIRAVLIVEEIKKEENNG